MVAHIARRSSVAIATSLLFALCASASGQRAPAAGGGNQPAAPTATGKVVAYDPEKSIKIEVRQRGGQPKTLEFAVSRERTKLELLGTTTAIEPGMEVRVWAETDDPKTAARISAGRAPNRRRQPNTRPATNPAQPRRPQAAPSMQPAPAEARKPAAVPSTQAAPPVPARKPRASNDAPAASRAIDREIDRVLDAKGLHRSAPADDAEFLRRVHLDLTGRIPPPEKVTAFLESKEPDKRARLIDELLADEAYGVHFADLWCDRINVKDLPIYREPFIAWLAERLNRNQGWDQIVTDMVTADGRFSFVTRGKRLTSDAPQALFLLLNTEEGMGKGPNPAWLTAESARLFMGAQLQCAECHDHPFTDAWKQTDFWGMAAFFSGLRGDRLQQGGLQWTETPAAAGKAVSIAIPPTALKNVGKSVPARLLSDDKGYQPSGDQQLLRRALARWMTAPDNPFFARAAANRTWAHLLGRGLVDPVDDLRPDNPATHPAILELLAAEFAKSEFDLKHLIRCVCLSQTYQRTSAPLPGNESDGAHYSHTAVKVIGPGAFYDCLKLATGFPEMKVGLPERKTKLTVASQFTPREVFVDFFRSSQGEEANPLENSYGIPQALKLLNAASLNGVAPVARQWATSGLGREQVVEQLYLTTLSRRPTPSEARLVIEFLERRKDARPEDGYSAALWALINTSEFASNH